MRDAVYLEQRRQIDAIRDAIGVEAYLHDMPRYVLAGMRRAPAITLDEILLASRADPELAAKLRHTERDIDARAVADVRALYAEAGIEVPADLAIRIRAGVAAFRRLAIAELV